MTTVREVDGASFEGELVSVEWVRLRLDVTAFDDARFEPYLQRHRQAGLEFCTMAELGDTTAEHRALYALNKACSADIPGRGAFYTFEEYLAQRVSTETYDPRGVVLAVDANTWVGMSSTSLRRDQGYAFSEMTGVLPSYRGRGLSLALKLLAVDFARSAGMQWLRTFHHPGNASAIAMNRRLGFVNDRQP